MTRLRLTLWILTAWPLPALLAGALGWKGVWGSGSALADYLIPLPVAGGVLHLPSFVLGAVAVGFMPSLGDVGASRLRALLLGLALTGVLWLLKLDDILLALQTGSKRQGSLWQENPLGLFLASDALIALAFSAWAKQRPLLRIEVLTPLLVLLPCLLPLAMAAPRSASDQPFRHGAARQSETRGDASRMVFTRLNVDAPDFRSRAEAWAEDMHPRFDVNVDDLAILFTRDLNAAARFDPAQAVATLCLYEDGTPSRWLPGAGDCFSDHLSFSERFSQAVHERPKGEHPDLRRYFGARKVCENVVPPATEPGRFKELASTRLCGSLARATEELRQRFPNEPQLREPPR